MASLNAAEMNLSINCSSGRVAGSVRDQVSYRITGREPIPERDISCSHWPMAGRHNQSSQKQTAHRAVATSSLRELVSHIYPGDNLPAISTGRLRAILHRDAEL
jgi:hypothetical protein